MIYCVVRGILGGYLPYVILYLLAGVIGEFVMWKTHYGNAKGLTISYIIIQVFASIGSTIYPYAITFQSLAGKSVADGRAANITEAAEILQQAKAEKVRQMEQMRDEMIEAKRQLGSMAGRIGNLSQELERFGVLLAQQNEGGSKEKA